MIKFFIILALLVLSTSTVSFADTSDQEFTLNDGSHIKGKLIGVKDGIYSVETPIIGQISIAAKDVASITNGNAPAANLPTNNNNLQQPASPSSGYVPDLDQRIATDQKQLMSNPQSMAILMKMTQDPDIMQALQDPTVVDAVRNHDYQAIANNPKIKELMSNPQMLSLVRELAGQMQHGQGQNNNTSQ